MRVFVTGASGFVGSAVVQELLGAGHQVLGLARSDANARVLEAQGAEVHRGDLEDLDSLRRGADAADGVIHTAFNHDFSRFQTSCEDDRRIIQVMGSTLAGSDRPLIVTSGIGILPAERVADENTMPAAGAAAHPRAATEQAADAIAERGVRVSVVRLPPSVHGEGDHGFVPILIGIARAKGASVYAEDGANLWPAVHRFDAARLYCLAVETAEAGARYHGVAEAGVAFREIAETIGRNLNVPVVSKAKVDAQQHFGWFAHFAAMNVPATSERTRRTLGWRPTEIGLLADLERSNYFRS